MAFEVLTAVETMFLLGWTPCGLVWVDIILLTRRNVSIFSPEDRVGILFRDVDIYVRVHETLQPRTSATSEVPPTSEHTKVTFHNKE